MADDAARSPDSTINNSEMEEQTTHHSSPSRPDPRGAIVADPDGSRNTPISMKRSHTEMSGAEDEGTPSASAPAPPAKQARKRKEPATATTGNPAIYSGNKVKHLKKDDGEPLWRKDIQYDFLKAVFDNKQKVFTNSYDPAREKETFADLYIDTMARSSKTSKILKDKLLTEHAPAKNMAMVCLLVNLGRMNTTLNCRFCNLYCEGFLIDCLQSFQRCVPNFEPTMLFLHYRRTKTQIHTSSFRMHHD